MAKTLIEHAEYELNKAGLTDNPNPEARKVATDTMALVKRFEKQQHTQMTAQWVVQFFSDLVNFIPLTTITDDPEEWEKFEIEQTNKETGEKTTVTRWQSRRCPSVMSEDEGKTWTDMATGNTGESAPAGEERKRVAEIRAAEEQRIKEAEEAKKNGKAKPEGDKTSESTPVKAEEKVDKES